jgi:hypothetical protein
MFDKNYICDYSREPIIRIANETELPQPRNASDKQTPLLDFKVFENANVRDSVVG